MLGLRFSLIARFSGADAYASLNKASLPDSIQSGSRDDLSASDDSKGILLVMSYVDAYMALK